MLVLYEKGAVLVSISELVEDPEFVSVGRLATKLEGLNGKERVPRLLR